MKRDGDDAWDSYLDDSSGNINRAAWDEDDWEGFLLRQDALNAKYQELFETLREHPQRDELIAREMHWNLPDDVAPPSDDDDDGEPDDELMDELDDPFDGEEAFVADLDTIPAYREAQDFALRVDRQLTGRLRERVADDLDAAQAVRAAVDVTDHLANGHGMGYERDTLCGNIACCNRAGRSLRECLDGLLSVRRRGVLPPSEADELLERGRATYDVVAHRTEDLRRRVWWC